MNLADILSDLMEFEPLNVDVPIIPSNETLSIEQEFSHLYHHLQRSTRLRQRRRTLFYAFKIGQLIETVAIRPQKSLFKSQMTTHFYQGCIRTYHIFLNSGVNQIFRTKLVTFVMIKKLKAQDFRSLCENIF